MSVPNTTAVATASVIAVAPEVTFALRVHTGLAAREPSAKPTHAAAKTIVLSTSLHDAHQLGRKRSDGPIDKTKASIAGRLKTSLVTGDGDDWAFEDAGCDGMVPAATPNVRANPARGGGRRKAGL